jgi:hypothetical protein
MNEKPNYYAIIPANVRYDNELKDKAKLLYGEITSLSTKDGYCYASNKYFANLYNVSTTTISLLIKNLVDKGYVESEIIYKEGTKEILNRYLKIIKDPYLKNLKYPIKENLKDNNTSINNTRNNKKEINKESLEDRFEEIWKLYPRKEGKSNAFKKYLKIYKEVSDNEIIEGINKYLEHIKKNNTPSKFIKMGSSWFNGECWNDIYEKEPEGKVEWLSEGAFRL